MYSAAHAFTSHLDNKTDEEMGDLGYSIIRPDCREPNHRASDLHRLRDPGIRPSSISSRRHLTMHSTYIIIDVASMLVYHTATPRHRSVSQRDNYLLQSKHPASHTPR